MKIFFFSISLLVSYYLLTCSHMFCELCNALMVCKTLLKTIQENGLSGTCVITLPVEHIRLLLSFTLANNDVLAPLLHLKLYGDIRVLVDSFQSGSLLDTPKCCFFKGRRERRLQVESEELRRENDIFSSWVSLKGWENVEIFCHTLLIAIMILVKVWDRMMIGYMTSEHESIGGR